MKSKNKFTLGQEKSCRRYKIMPYMLNCVLQMYSSLLEIQQDEVNYRQIYFSK